MMCAEVHIRLFIKIFLVDSFGRVTGCVAYRIGGENVRR